MLQPIIILFYPEVPEPETAIYQLCEHLDYQISNNQIEPFDAVIKCFDATFFSLGLLEVLYEIRSEIINVKCLDLSRKLVGEKFAEVFNYPLNLDPSKYTGKIIKRSNILGFDAPEILTAPFNLKHADQDFVYQKFIETQATSLQAVICGDRLPFVLQITDNIAELKSPEQVFSSIEIDKIILLAKQLGIDFGALEILRDQTNQKIYIVNAEDTTWRFPSILNKAQKKEALEKISPLFISLASNRF